MARNGSGTYNLVSGNPVVTGTTISSTWANNTLNDIAVALSGSISADGQTPITANLPMAGYKLTNVAAGALRSEYARIDQLQDSTVIWLTSVTGTDTITANVSINPVAYTAGQMFRFISAGTNTTTLVTINVNGIGAKTITKKGSASVGIGDLPANSIITVVYDGINFQVIGIETRQFRVYATATPGMTLNIDAGNIQQQTTLTSIAMQTTTAFVAPVTNPRNDLIVLDESTGVYSVVAGTEAAIPSDPAIPVNKIALARVRLTVGMTAINSTNLDDLLPLFYINDTGIQQTAADVRYGAAMPPFNASTISNLITATIAPCKVDFRNTSLTVGTPIEYNVASTLSLAMTSIAGSLGATTAVKTSLIYALVYVAGTPQLAVCNLSGGLQMDETNLITTTAIGAGSTAANVWYSTTAIATPSQYRIIGRVDATWTSGIGWSIPALVQPVGSGITTIWGLGYRPWVDKTASRALGTTYYNPNSYPIFIAVSNYMSSYIAGTVSIVVNGLNIVNTGAASGATGSGFGGAMVVVPPYGSYSATCPSYGSLNKWMES